MDKAIYRYYEHYKKECRKSELVSTGGCYGSIALKIGKSDVRVRKAVDRYEFKRDNQSFTKRIEEEHRNEPSLKCHT